MTSRSEPKIRAHDPPEGLLDRYYRSSTSICVQMGKLRKRDYRIQILFLPIKNKGLVDVFKAAWVFEAPNLRENSSRKAAKRQEIHDF